MRPHLITRACEHCGATMQVHPYRVRQGTGRYCSRSCHYAAVRASFVERFWLQVDRSGDCWLWTGGLSTAGYGVTSLNNRWMLAHRASYQLTYGDIPRGLFVCHECDTPACVRPEHLFLGTALDNTQDMVAKGRAGRGGARLTQTQVKEIRRLYAVGGVTQRELAERHGVAPATISAVVRGSTWRQDERAEVCS